MSKTAARPKKQSPATKNLASAKVAGNGKMYPDLEELLLGAVKDLYWAENHLVGVLPKVQEAAKAPSLRKAVGDHLKVTRGHVQRLERVFELLGTAPQAKKCDAMEGLAMEGQAVINSTKAGTPARDRGLTMACQKVEHYEIASYRGLILLANQLGKTDIANTLKQTLAEEEDADNTLTALAEKSI